MSKEYKVIFRNYQTNVTSNNKENAIKKAKAMYKRNNPASDEPKVFQCIEKKRYFWEDNGSPLR